MTQSQAIAIARAIERGTDQARLLRAIEARERQKAVAWLYTEVPTPVRAYYRQTDREKARVQARLTRIEERALAELLRLEREQAESVLANLFSSEEEKRLARIALVEALEWEDPE